MSSDLFQEMDKKNPKVKERIQIEFARVQDFLEKVPTRLELFTYMEDDIYQLAMNHSKDNPFKNYLEFLHHQKLLNVEEDILYNNIGREFIQLIENTSMSKVYKMPVLMAFYNRGNVRMSVTEEELLISWKEFFGTGTNWKDLDKGLTYEKYIAISDKAHISKIMKMPVHYLQESGKGFFVKEEGTALALRSELQDMVVSETFALQMKDVIEYRTMDYYRRRYREEN